MMAHAALSICRTLSPAVETYLDGELDPSQMVEVEAHLAQCPNCRERVALDRATRVSMRRALTQAPSSLRDRMRGVMAAERAQQVQPARVSTPLALVPAVSPDASAPEPSSLETISLEAVPAPDRAGAEPPVARHEAYRGRDRRAAPRAAKPLRARYALPFAVAAGVAFAFSMHHVPSSIDGPQLAAADATKATLYNPVNAASMTGLDGIIDDLVSLHAHPLPPEVTQQDEVRNFDPFVGVPVEPPKFQSFGAKWVGGRMLPLRDSRAAMLQYSLAGGHRITVYVYDPRRVKQESNSLHERMVRNSPVFVGNVRGYSVAATERRGVGYAVATDLDEPESVELVAAAVP